MKASSSFVADAPDEPELRKIAALYEHDQRIRDAALLDEIARPGQSVSDIFQAAVERYADRPALGERAAELVADPVTGRTSRRLLPRFETLSYRELGAHVESVAAEWHHDERSPLRRAASSRCSERVALTTS